MKFIFDITRLYVRRNELTPTGIDRVDINYVLFALKSGQDVIFVKGERGGLITFPKSEAISIISKLLHLWVGISFPANASCKVEEKKPILKVIDPDEEYVYINAGNHVTNGKDGLIELSSRANVKLIYFCHDLIPIDYPEYAGDNHALEKHSAVINLMLWTGDLIVLNSEYTKNCIINYANRNNFECPELAILHIGNENFLAKSEWKSTDQHYHFLYVSTFEPRKNHLLLFLVWKKLYSILGEKTPRLLIVGKKGWKIDWLERYFSVEPNVSRFVQRKDKVNDEELKRLMLGSYATLNPSHVEGWGLPAVESVAMGIPTACSDIEAYREATQGLATYISPLNGDAWVDYVLDVLAGKVPAPVAEKFVFDTWEEHFISLDKILSQLVGRTDKNARNLYAKNIDLFNLISAPKPKPPVGYSRNKERFLRSKHKIIRIFARLFYNKTL